jgi:hypothetical protein
MLPNQLGPVKSTDRGGVIILEYDGFGLNFRLEGATLFENTC